MKIFVTGATGYVGGAVARALIAGGHQVSGLARSAAALEKLERAGVGAISGELDDVEVLERAAHDHDASVHAASTSGDDRVLLDRAATEALLAGARRASQPRVVIYTSGVWTLGQSAAAGDEDAAVDHPAAASKHRPALEREVLERGDGGLTTAVIRPGMLYGGRSGIAATLCGFLPQVAGFGRAVTYLGDGGNRWSPVHHDDVGALYRLVIEKRAAGIFHAVETEPVRVIDAARALAAASGWGEPRSFALADARAKLGPLADAFALDNPAAARRSRALGWSPARGPFASTVAETFSDFQPTGE